MMPRRLPTRSRNLAAFAGLAALIGACAPDRAVTGSIYPHDHHARHPIVLADGPRNLDVFIVGPACSIRASARTCGPLPPSTAATARAR